MIGGFVALLLILMPGEPPSLNQSNQRFDTMEACEAFVAQDRLRIEKIVEPFPVKPEWVLKCAPYKAPGQDI